MLSILMMIASLQDAVPAAPSAVAPVASPAESGTPPLRVVNARRPIGGFSEAADAAGHTGRVVVEADVLPNGKFGPALVVETSRSDLLDAEAVETLNAASVPAPSEPYRMRVTVEFNPTDMLNMKCDEFLRQVRWYEAAWPERSFKDPTIYTMSVGTLALLAMQRSSSASEILAPARTVEKAWPLIIADCERQPSRPYLQVLGARAN